jgi:hypothetical protein
MVSKVQNLTHRLVSVRGNSGETWHLPPGGALELPTAETVENDKMSKLVANGILSVESGESAEQVPAAQKKRR